MEDFNFIDLLQSTFLVDLYVQSLQDNRQKLAINTALGTRSSAPSDPPSFPVLSRSETDNSMIVCDDFPLSNDEDDEEMLATPSLKRRSSTDSDFSNIQKRIRHQSPSQQNDGEHLVEDENPNLISGLNKLSKPFIKQDSKSRQPKMDVWVTRSPKVTSKEKEEKNILNTDDENKSSHCSVSSARRTATPSKNPSTPSSQTRSGSIKQTSSLKGRSLLLALNQDNASQDSFSSEADTSEHFDITRIDPEPGKQHLYLARHMTAQRRWGVNRLGLGPRGKSVKTPETGHQQLSSSR